MNDDTNVNELTRIKNNIEKAYQYFKPNYDRFNYFRKFVFNTTIDTKISELYNTLKKPALEFNILEAYISRLRGEFSKQEPSIEVMAGDEEQVDPKVIETVQGHLKHILDEANKDGFEYQIYTDTLSGGFSVGKIWTEYAHEMSFNQVIKIGRVYDPILCGFDPMARQPHKGDGNFSFELFPMTKNDFKSEYPDVNIDKMKFTGSIEGFSWAYKSGKDDIVLVGDYYEKKKSEVEIVNLSDKRTMKIKDYRKLIKNWDKTGNIEQPPVIVGNPRKTKIETIVRTVVIDNAIIETEVTDYKILPHIFFDGNSALMRDERGGSIHQMTRPYVYQAKGMQILKNFSGVSLAAEIANTIQHKFKVARESIPEERDFQEAYQNTQNADVLVYNYLDPNRQDVTLPAPQEIQRVPIPPELTGTFQGADALTQTILGNFDMDLGKINQQQISGIAVQESITQSNSAAMPYIVGFLQGLGRIMYGCVDLLPKYIVTPRTIPVVGIDGKRSYQSVNQEGGIEMKYGDNALNVKIKPGVNFSVQKSRNFATIVALQQSSPQFAEFMATEGMMFLLKNVEMQGIDELKMAAEQWQQQMREMKQQQMEQAKNSPNPEMIKMEMMQQKMESDSKKNEMDIQIKAEELKVKHMDAELRHDATIKKAEAEEVAAALRVQVERMKLQHEHGVDHHKATHDMREQEHKHAKDKAEMALKHIDMEHKHAKDYRDEERAKKDNKKENKIK